jgi:L-arabinose isomerase
VLRQVAQQPAGVVRDLTSSGDLPLRVVQKPVLTSAEAIRTMCLDATAASQCVGVIAWMHTFSPAKAWIGGLNALDKPLLHLHTQANLSLPWHEIDMDFMNLNQAAHGDREFAFIETRMRVRRKTVVGHCSQPETKARVASWMRAARGWHEAARLRVVGAVDEGTPLEPAVL